MNEETGVIDAIVDRAREAQRVYENMGSQALFDSACQAVAWVLMCLAIRIQTTIDERQHSVGTVHRRLSFPDATTNTWHHSNGF